MSNKKYCVEAESRYRTYYYNFLAQNPQDAIEKFLKKINKLGTFFTKIKAKEVIK